MGEIELFWNSVIENSLVTGTGICGSSMIFLYFFLKYFWPVIIKVKNDICDMLNIQRSMMIPELAPITVNEIDKRIEHHVASCQLNHNTRMNSMEEKLTDFEKLMETKVDSFHDLVTEKIGNIEGTIDLKFQNVSLMVDQRINTLDQNLGALSSQIDSQFEDGSKKFKDIDNSLKLIAKMIRKRDEKDNVL